ncbi:MAG: hypothetical protein JXR77_18475 [Lentisphaeria bacterium]|nr:hypothetical protein [Lentisphaeria bacterium]
MSDRQSSAPKTLDQLDDMVHAYQHARILLSAVELDLFSHIGAGGAEAREIAVRAGTDPRATEMLLNALTAIGILAKREGRFHLGEVAADHLVAGALGDARPLFLHVSELWRRWSVLTDCVRRGAPAPAAESGRSCRRGGG